MVTHLVSLTTPSHHSFLCIPSSISFKNAYWYVISEIHLSHEFFNISHYTLKNSHCAWDRMFGIAFVLTIAFAWRAWFRSQLSSEFVTETIKKTHVKKGCPIRCNGVLYHWSRLCSGLQQMKIQSSALLALCEGYILLTSGVSSQKASIAKKMSTRWHSLCFIILMIAFWWRTNVVHRCCLLWSMIIRPWVFKLVLGESPGPCFIIRYDVLL